MRVGRQPDQRRPPFLVSLRGLDHRDLGAVGGVHHLTDVRQPLRACCVELSLDEVAHVCAGRGFALRAVAEVEAPACERHVFVALCAAVPTGPREHEGRVGDALDDYRRCRLATARDVVQFESLELGLRVACQLLVQLFLLHVAVQHDDAASRVGQCGHVPNELKPGAGRQRIEAVVQLDAFRAALRFCRSVQESICLGHDTSNLTPFRTSA